MITLEIIGGLIREASKSEKDLISFEADTTATREKLSQALKVATAKACEACFNGSLQGLSGKAMADAGGVSAQAVSRYIVAGQLMANLVDDETNEPLIEPGKVIRDLANSFIDTKTAKQAETITAYNKAVAQGKREKSGVTPKTPEQTIEAKLVESLKHVKTGKVTLERWEELVKQAIKTLSA